MSEPEQGSASPEPPQAASPPPKKRGYALKPVERRVALARQPWPEFLRDLAIRTVAVAVIVAIVMGVLLLLARR